MIHRTQNTVSSNPLSHHFGRRDELPSGHEILPPAVNASQTRQAIQLQDLHQVVVCVDDVVTNFFVGRGANIPRGMATELYFARGDLDKITLLTVLRVWFHICNHLKRGRVPMYLATPLLEIQ